MPIPPVFSPLSSSCARLWSIDETIGATVLPSVKASTETSGPVKNSSTTTLLPLLPKARFSIMVSTAETASSRVSAISTPLPNARPSAFTTTGKGQVLT